MHLLFPAWPEIMCELTKVLLSVHWEVGEGMREVAV